MTFAQFSRMNRARCESPQGFAHALNSWSRSDWFTAAMGELGEAANVAKKLNRIRDGVPGNGIGLTEDSLRADLADEVADAVIYLDLLLQAEGLDLGEAVRDKFNRKSVELGSPEKLPTTTEAAEAIARMAEERDMARAQTVAARGVLDSVLDGDLAEMGKTPEWAYIASFIRDARILLSEWGGADAASPNQRDRITSKSRAERPGPPDRPADKLIERYR